MKSTKLHRGTVLKGKRSALSATCPDKNDISHLLLVHIPSSGSFLVCLPS